MTPRQEKFCREYIVDMNATQAAIRAGYKAQTAYSMGSRLLKHVEIQRRIQQLRESYFDSTIASAKEAEAFLAQALRGEVQEEVIVTQSAGDGVSVTKIVRKQLPARDRIKAAELIGRRNSLFTDKVQVDGEVTISVAERLKKAREMMTDDQ